MNEREIFLAAQAIADPSERSAYLEQILQGDEVAIRRIEGLLAAARTDSFLELADRDGMDATQESEISEKPGGTIGPYKLLEQIGEGGFGVVFMAEQSQPVRRTVALKVIKPGMDSRQAIARFEAERQALAIMDHPNIASVLDAGTTDSGRPYFVMDLVKGVPITEFCDGKRLGLAERLELFVFVCHAIQHAHSKGVIHRDIKPGNVLVAMYDDRPVPKVIDFGVAKATGQQLTERTLHTGFGAVVGSLEYMSPEQASFNQLDIDTRSDVYSLGVLLYELLTGAPPLSLSELRRIGMLESLRLVREAETIRPSLRLSTGEGLASLAASRNVEPARLTAIVKGDLDWIVMKALDKDRNRRYLNVNGLSDEIGRYLRGEPVLAHPPSQIYRIRKFTARHWQACVTLATLLLLTGIVAILLLRSANQRKLRIATHSARVTAATNEATMALGNAQNASIGQQSQWVAVRAAAGKLQELLDQQFVDESAQASARRFLKNFQRLNTSRNLAEQIEGVVILSATHADLESWQRMERQFHALFQQEGMDADGLSPEEFAERIRAHPSSSELCDALELWIGTKGQISALGGAKATRDSMQPMANAMYAADPDPVRTGIRRLIYGGTRPTEADVDAVIQGVALEELSPRTLSWLASVYGMAGSHEKSVDVFYRAVDRYPDDFMLNFDFAYTLVAEENWPDAIRYFLRSTALRPDVSGIWRALGNAYRENEEHERSRQALTRAIKLDMQHGPIFIDLAETLLKLADHPAAETAARQAISFGSRGPRAFYFLGQALMGQAEYAQAIVAFKEAEKLSRAGTSIAISIAELVSECKRKLSESVNPSDE